MAYFTLPSPEPVLLTVGGGNPTASKVLVSTLLSTIYCRHIPVESKAQVLGL
jgi:hypothetical protein